MGTNTLTTEELMKTMAFQRRNAEWPALNWDYTEWDECLEEAKQELRNGKIHPDVGPSCRLPPTLD